MTQYPPGAGPYGARFAGEVYVPPSQQASLIGDPSTTATRPFILQAVAQADSAGRMVAMFSAPTTTAWLVRRITVQSSIRSQAKVYIGSVIDPANFVSGTIAGDLDENDPNQAYLVPEGQSLFVHWTGGGNCRARIEYQEV